MVAKNLEMPPPSVPEYEIELPKYKRPGEPEHYRLSAARLGATKSVSEPTKRLVVSGRYQDSNKYFFVDVPVN